MVNDREPNKANYTWALETRPAQTLGATAQQDCSNYIRSAAGRVNGAFTNNRFVDFMRSHGYPNEPTAQLCVRQ